MSGVPIDFVFKKLKKAYPDAECTLDWTTPFELLVATILSAQCTDVRVNLVTRQLFRKYRRPENYLKVPERELEQDIRSCGTYHAKARAIRESCRMIIDRFHGKVPRTMAELITLRGVGRKTAAVVLGTVFNVVEGIPVDTHVTRVSKRLGLTKHTEQGKIEADLMRKAPKQNWMMLSHMLIAHGRNICHARNRECERCVFKKECPSSKVMGKRDRARD